MPVLPSQSVPTSVFTHPPLIKYLDFELYFHGWVWMGQQLHFSLVCNQFIYSKRLMCLLCNRWGSMPLQSSEANGILAWRAEGSQQDAVLSARKCPQTSWEGSKCLKNTATTWKFYYIYLLSKGQNIANYPFCLTTVNKGTQVLLIVEAWSKSYYFAIIFMQGIALFICCLCLHLTTQERPINSSSGPSAIPS